MVTIKIGYFHARTAAGARKQATGRYVIDKVKYTGNKSYTGQRIYSVYGHDRKRRR